MTPAVADQAESTVGSFADSDTISSVRRRGWCGRRSSLTAVYIQHYFFAG